MKWQEGLCENSSDCLFIHGSIVYVHSKNGRPALCVRLRKTLFATLLCASYMSENQQRSRAKIIRVFFNFCPTINDADSDIYLR